MNIFSPAQQAKYDTSKQVSIAALHDLSLALVSTAQWKRIQITCNTLFLNIILIEAPTL
ncbi:hypothetical protein [Aliikangiella sp. IMCC44632]